MIFHLLQLVSGGIIGQDGTVTVIRAQLTSQLADYLFITVSHSLFYPSFIFYNSWVTDLTMPQVRFVDHKHPIKLSGIATLFF